MSTKKGALQTGPEVIDRGGSSVDFGAVAVDDFSNAQYDFCISYIVDEQNPNELKWYQVYQSHMDRFDTGLKNGKWLYTPLTDELQIPPYHKIRIQYINGNILRGSGNNSIHTISYQANIIFNNGILNTNITNTENYDIEIETRYSLYGQCAAYNAVIFSLIDLNVIETIPHGVYTGAIEILFLSQMTPL